MTSRDADELSLTGKAIALSMQSRTLNEAQDFDFLKKSINLDELELNCMLYGIDKREAVEKCSIFEENGKHCLALDHFYWFDKKGNETDAPRAVIGNFDCSDCTSLTSLQGVPQKVGGEFWCLECTSLTSLQSAPREVVGDFYCIDCTSLTSLEGAPQKVGGSFYCVRCTSLTSLEGAPQEVGRDFSCYECTSLTSLEGAPQKINGYFDCSECASLLSLEGAPQEVDRYFCCDGCISLTSLEGAPRKIGSDLNHNNTKLTSSQVQAYLDWLKTDQKENYHELKLSESMSFIRSIIRGNDDEAKAILESMMKKRVAKMMKQALGI